MNPEKVVFGFFIVMSLTLNFGFFWGDIDNPEHHHVYELMAAIFVNLVATILKFGDRSQVGAVLLATSLAADLQLIAAALVWGMALYVEPSMMTAMDAMTAMLDTEANTAQTLSPEVVASIVSLSGGALLANVVSVLLLVVETMMLRR